MVRERFEKVKCWRPSLGLAVAVLIAAGGLAFALLQSQAKLVGNSISTETAGLMISHNDDNYGETASGYTFTGIVPGSRVSEMEHFYLKNTGSAPLSLRLSLDGAPTNPDGVDLDKVHVILTPINVATGALGAPQDLSLQSLLDSDAGGATLTDSGNLAANDKEELGIQMGMDADAISGSGASLSNISLDFNGAGVVNTD